MHPSKTLMSHEMDEEGKVTLVRCTADFESTRRVKGVINWVGDAEPAEFRLYQRLFDAEYPEANGSFMEALNPNSLSVTHGLIPRGTFDKEHMTRFQLERHGYFVVDEDTTPDRLVLNRIVTMRR